MLSDMTSGVFGPVANVLMASLQAEPEKRRKAFQLANFASAGLAFPVFGGLIVVAPMAIPAVFGAQWTQAVFALQCLSVIGMFTGLATVQAALIRNLGRPDWWFWYRTLSKIAGLVVIVGFAPRGLDAIMVGLVVVTIALWPFAVGQSRRMLAISLADYFEGLRGPALATAVMAVAVLNLRDMTIGMGTATQLAVLVATGALVYGVTLAALSRQRMSQALAHIRQSREARA
jgi:teichuronic acid exporter